MRDVGINRAVALIADKEIRRSRAHGPNRALRELGRRRAGAAQDRLLRFLRRPPAPLRLPAEGPRPGGRDTGRCRGSAGTPEPARRMSGSARWAPRGRGPFRDAGTWGGGGADGRSPAAGFPYPGGRGATPWRPETAGSGPRAGIARAGDCAQRGGLRCSGN